MSDRTFAMINGALAVVWLWISWVSTDVFQSRMGLAVAALQIVAAVAYYVSQSRPRQAGEGQWMRTDAPQ